MRATLLQPCMLASLFLFSYITVYMHGLVAIHVVHTPHIRSCQLVHAGFVSWSHRKFLVQFLRDNLHQHASNKMSQCETLAGIHMDWIHLK